MKNLIKKEFPKINTEEIKIIDLKDNNDYEVQINIEGIPHIVTVLKKI